MPCKWLSGSVDRLRRLCSSSGLRMKVIRALRARNSINIASSGERDTLFRNAAAIDASADTAVARRLGIPLVPQCRCRQPWLGDIDNVPNRTTDATSGRRARRHGTANQGSLYCK